MLLYPMQTTFKILLVFFFLLLYLIAFKQEEEGVPFEEIYTILNKVIRKNEMMGGGTIQTAR